MCGAAFGAVDSIESRLSFKSKRMRFSPTREMVRIVSLWAFCCGEFAGLFKFWAVDSMKLDSIESFDDSMRFLFPRPCP